MSKVKCKYCGEEMERNEETCIKISSRYAHTYCDEKAKKLKKQEEEDKEKLIQYIKQVFKIQELPNRTERQIREFKRDHNYSYSSMYKCLYWWYSIKQKPTNLAYQGIGIIPFIYDEAYDYYYKIHLANQRNLDKEDFGTEVIEVTIPAPTLEKRHKTLFFEE